MGQVVYNTLKKVKEDFVPLEAGKVKMYVCGPTVYDLLHIGNFRGAIFFNLVRNWLEFKGLKVTYVYNYTDVDDKIINKANDQGVTSQDVSEKFITEFEKDFFRLGLKRHDHNPKVTQYIDDIVEFVKSLVDQDMAYVIDGEVFYSIDKYKDYGKLSGKNLDELEAGQRVEVDTRKHNPFDFVLWKPSKPGEPSWQSPWGAGRPGWHIECSAMIHSILGETIDIHGGGIDLIFPHHENEIAQGEGRTRKTYGKYWMHNNFINLKDQKMSKSLGNVISARSFMDSYHPEILKYVMLSVHYRSMLTVSDDKINDCVAGLDRVYKTKLLATSILAQGADGEANNEFCQKLKEADGKIETALNDDFNTGEMFSQVFEIVRAFNALGFDKKPKTTGAKATAKAFLQWMDKYSAMSALFNEEPLVFLKFLDDLYLKQQGRTREQVDQLVTARSEARARKDFAKADELRNKLSEWNIELQDGNQEFPWTVKKS